VASIAILLIQSCSSYWAAKEMLADIYDIQITEVDDLILQHIVDFRMTGMEFDQYTNAEGYATRH
jgi:hypothetical protein